MRLSFAAVSIGDDDDIECSKLRPSFCEHLRRGCFRITKQKQITRAMILLYALLMFHVIG